MKVKDLITQLQTLDPDTTIILQLDTIACDFSPLNSINLNCVYDATYNQVLNTTWTAEYADMEDADWAMVCAKPRCVILIPEGVSYE